MFIPGPEGQLEALLEYDSTYQDFAIIAHPHPQYGGSMSDNVVTILAKAFSRAGINTLKFNFRGVGLSESSYDDGKGEVADVQAAVTWSADTYPEARYYLCGYSFGAIMVLKALDDKAGEPRLRGSVLVAPPMSMLTGPPVISYPLLVLAGEADPIVPLKTAITAFGSFVKIIDGSDHFFHGKDRQIMDYTQEFIDAT